MHKIFRFLITLALFISYLLVFPHSALAVVSSCSASVSPTKVNTSTTGDFTFTVTNNDAAVSAVWMQITRASQDFSLNTASATGWIADNQGASILFNGGSIGPNASLTVTLNATSGEFAASSANWVVQVSDDAGGASPVACTGDLGTAIVDPSSNPAISNITISDVNTSSVKISWTTNINATSIINYGSTSGYGSTKSDATLATSHSLTVDSLSTNTSYHYQLVSVDGSGNTTQTSDNTFTTASSTTTTTTTTTVVVTQAPQKTTTTKAPGDTTPPAVTLDTDFSKPFNDSSPKITGHASDNVAVSRIEYSLDGGKNWQPVDTIKSPGARSSIFDFTPLNLPDDNYKLKVRAIDNSGNVGMSKVYTLIIDRLPPLVGPSLFSVGPQILSPGLDGMLLGLVGLDQKITVSSVGGPVTVDLVSGEKMFSLAKNVENGLWSGVLSFDEPGLYTLTAKAIDGAGTSTTRKLNSILILPQGKITDGKKVISGAIISVYYFDSLSNQFILWDGKSYGQKNPQRSTKEGKYSLFLPQGTYYIEVQASGFRPFKTSIFNVGKSTPINSQLILMSKQPLQIGPIALPAFFDFGTTQQTISISIPSANSTNQKNGLIGKIIPTIDLKDNDKIISTDSIRGKPTILTILASWDPATPAELAILNKVSQNQDIRVIGVFPQESASRISIYRKRGAYTLTLLSDPDGQLVLPLNIQSLPMHLFLDRKGIVWDVKYGVLTADEIEKVLSE